MGGGTSSSLSIVISTTRWKTSLLFGKREGWGWAPGCASGSVTGTLVHGRPRSIRSHLLLEGGTVRVLKHENRDLLPDRACRPGLYRQGPPITPGPAVGSHPQFSLHQPAWAAFFFSPVVAARVLRGAATVGSGSCHPRTASPRDRRRSPPTRPFTQ